MGPYLLDVNVLVARFWPQHVHHATVGRWLESHRSSGWATTPQTQAAFVRITSNPSFSPLAVRPNEAFRLLEENLRRRGHVFWSDDLDFAAACGSLVDHLTGHRQVMDAYLLGIASYRRGRVATFDAGLAALARSAGLKSGLVEVLKA